MRTILVTGSASGLGAALVRRLEGAGHRVIGLDRRDAPIVADLGTPDGRAAGIVGAKEACGGSLEGVVSCAGLGPYDDPQAICRVNYFGAVAILDGLKAELSRGSAPAAVAISSIGAGAEMLMIPEYLQACRDGDEKLAQELMAERDGTTSYANAKRALAEAVKRRAVEWAPEGIRINAVAPGKMETPMLDRLLSDAAHAPAIEAMPVPVGRHGSADEIAGVVAFLLGPDASYVQGQVIIADGGSNALLDPTRF
ncbi:MAG: SDR family oxidoreductase [Myxococcota bacterium]|nr:SDR family oxidoreductase [Myxococcota bacterium]